jgi:hypothetical protein
MAFLLGSKRTIDAKTELGAYSLPAHHLLTHGVIVGMTGSGKTGLVTVLVEEALRAEIPVLLVDVKGDLPNLALAFPSFDPAAMAPWVEPGAGDEDGLADEPLVREAVETRRKELAKWKIGSAELADFAARTHVRVVTPGSDAGEGLHLLSALERRSPRWDHDLEGARATLNATVSMVLRLIGRNGDPAQSREHALLTTLAEARLARGRSAELSTLLVEIVEPPIAEIGALEVDAFMPKRARAELARRSIHSSRRRRSLRGGVDKTSTSRSGCRRSKARRRRPSSASRTSTTKTARSCSASCSRRRSRGCGACRGARASRRSSCSTKCMASFRRTRRTRRRSARSSRS